LHPWARDAPAKGAYARGVIVTTRSAIRESTATPEDLFKGTYTTDPAPN